MDNTYNSEILRIEKNCFSSIRLKASRGERLVDAARTTGKNLDHKLLSVIEDIEFQLNELKQEIKNRSNPD